MVFSKLKYLQSFAWSVGLTLAFFIIPARLYADVPLDRIVAVVNDDVVMQSELAEKLRTVISQIEQQGTAMPPLSTLERQVLERIILGKLQLQMAITSGIRVDDETLNRTISNIASENKVTLTQFREILEKDGYSYEKFRENIRDEITITRLRQRQVDNRITVTDREIDNYLSNEEIQGTIEEEYRISHILIAFPEGATQEDIEQTHLVAKKVHDDLAEGQDFATLAASLSDGQQAMGGGDLGWKKKEDIPTLFIDYINDLKVGETSELIQSPSGFHIIKLSDHRSAEKHIITQTEARHILLRTNELMTEEDVLIRLRQLKTRIDGGDDFAELAKAHSEDTVSAAEGGSLGWVSPGSLVHEFEAKMNELKPGEVSEPFNTQFGWHIVQVLGHREYDNTEELKRAKAREAIRQRKIEEAHQNWLRHMREEAYVEYRINEY